MAVNKVVVNDETILDLTGDTVTAADLRAGVTAHAANGEQITGTALGGITAAQYSLTLTMGGWYTDGSYRAQQVTVSGLKASYDVSPDVDCELSGTDADGDAAILEGWALVHYAQTGAGTITFKCCGDAPTVNIPVVVRVFE